jgi:hypothetical protein
MNLAIKRKIWTMQQEIGNGHTAWKKWFVFIDTDTFVEWDNLLGLLEHLDASKQIYMAVQSGCQSCNLHMVGARIFCRMAH